MQVQGYRYNAAGAELQVQCCRYRAAGTGLQVEGCRCRAAGTMLHSYRAAGRRLQVQGCRYMTAGAGQVQGCRCRAAGTRLQVHDCRYKATLMMDGLWDFVLIILCLVRVLRHGWFSDTRIGPCRTPCRWHTGIGKCGSYISLQ